VAKQMGAAYMECSAKEGRGVQEVFELAINTVVKVEDESYEAKPNHQGQKVKKAKKRKCAFL